MESQITGEIKKAAFEYALYKDLLTINDETREALGAAEKGARAAYISGAGAQPDILLAQTAITRTESERETLERQKDIMRERIESLLGAGVDKGLLEGLCLNEPRDLPALDVLLKRLPGAPQIKAALSGVNETKTQMALAKKAFYPEFEVGARYRYKDMSMGGSNYLTAVAGITIPWFHWKDRYRPALEEAAAEKESARFRVDSVMTASRYALADSYQEAARNLKIYRLFKNGLLLQAGQAYKSALANYQVGKVDFTTLLKALTDLYRDEADTLSAKAGYYKATAGIETVLGANPESLHAVPDGLKIMEKGETK